MPLDEICVRYLNGQRHGRLATVSPGGRSCPVHPPGRA